MKRNAESKIGRIFKRIFNVRAWADWDRVKAFTVYLLNGIKKYFVPQGDQGKGESFAAAKARLNLTDEELLSKQQGLFRLSVLMVTVAVLLLGYSVYHVFCGSFRAVVVSCVVMVISLVLAFRYHFWYFQIKERKLGCSIAEWFKHGLKGERDE